MGDRRDVFSLRFKDGRVRDGLKMLSEQSGMSMTDIAEAAIAHEIVLQSEDIERRLSDALEVVRSYRPAEQLDSYLDAFEEGEASDLDPFTRVASGAASGLDGPHASAAEERFGIAAAFSR